MKKIYLSIFAMLLSVSLFAERVTLDDAALVANNFMNVASNTAAKTASVKHMVRKTTATETQYYVYENANGEGWVLIAANDVVSPILAYSETGHFRTDNMPSNVSKWLGHYDKFITKLDADGIVAAEETTAEWNALRKGVRKAKAAVVVEPLIQTQWDQDEPYNNLCPGTGSDKSYTGCVATAMAQVMKYWNWPEKGTGSRTYQPIQYEYDERTGQPIRTIIIYDEQTANFGETTYDWDNMLNKYTGSETTAQNNAVATLMYHCGVATDMMYGNDDYGGSGTFTVNYDDWDWADDEGECAQNALVMFFGYKKNTIKGYMRDGYEYGGTTYYEKWSDADWTAMIKEELDKKHPIMYGGAGDEGGHSFICDGYKDDDYFHFNWGWSGQNDGYYKLSKLAPGSGGAGGGGYDFSEDQDVIIGIVPNKGDGPKITVTWSVNGEETTSEFEQDDALVLPANPSACEDGKEFVGWTANSEVNGEKPADLFTTAKGKSVTADITYYAVFAVATKTNEPKEVASVTFNSADHDSNKDNSASIADNLVQTYYGIASFSGTKLYLGKEGVKMGSSDKTGSITLTLEDSYIISKVEVNASQYKGKNGNADTGKLKVTVGETVLGDPQTPAENLAFIADPAIEANTITIETTTKRAYLASITITAGGSISYSDYTTMCETTAVENVQTIQRATKVIENGQIYIIIDNEKYTIFGQHIQ